MQHGGELSRYAVFQSDRQRLHIGAAARGALHVAEKRVLARPARSDIEGNTIRVTVGKEPTKGLAWLITGKTVGGTRLHPQRNCLDRETLLRMWTENDSASSTLDFGNWPIVAVRQLLVPAAVLVLV